MKKVLQGALPVVAALLLFALAACIYCSPVFKGKVIYAGDTASFTSAVNESMDYYEKTGDYTFWTGSMFCGMPNYQIGGGASKAEKFLLPLSYLFRFDTDNPVWKIILYFICFFILLRCFGVGRWTSIAGAFAIGLSSYFITIIGAGHNTKCYTIALAAVVTGGFQLIFQQKKYLLGAILAVVFTARSFSLHPQMYYYFCMLIGLLFIAQAYTHIKEKRFKDLGIATAVFALSLLVGVGTGSSNVFTNSEYVKESIRGGSTDIVRSGSAVAQEPSNGLDLDYATQWSYGVDETMSFLIPGFLGGSNAYPLGKDSKLYKDLVKLGVPARSASDFCANAPMYWGDQPFTAGNVYMGAIICFLFLLGLLIVKGPYKWALLAATIFSTALSWGHNCMWLTEFFFKYFPLYSKFRAVSSILVVAEVAMPLLGFLAIKELMEGKVERKQALKSIYIAGGITAGICLFFALLGKSLFDFTSAGDAAWASNLPKEIYAAIIDQRASLLASDSLRSAIFIALAVVALWIYVKGKMKAGVFVAVLGVLIVADMWPVNKRYFNDNNFVSPKAQKETFTKLPYEELLLQDPDPNFRVFNLTVSTFNDARTSYYLKSIGGYNAAKLRRYQDIIEEHLSKYHMPVLNMLNAKYFIVPGDNGEAQVQRNPDAMGNAWWVGSLQVVDSAAEESDALMEIDLSTTAVLDRKFAGSVSNFNPGIAEDASVRLTNYTPKSLDYVTTSSADGTVVFSEVYYPYGWKAAIDGQKAEIFRVNYLLRALNVPAGQHEIHFVFDPDSVKKGTALSLVCIAIMYLLVAAGAVIGIRKLVKS